jgi:hypothetical protein
MGGSWGEGILSDHPLRDERFRIAEGRREGMVWAPGTEKQGEGKRPGFG